MISRLSSLSCLLAALAPFALPGCVTPSGSSAARAPQIEFEPLVVEAGPDHGLAGKNDEELFALGSAAFESEDFRRAAEAFSRVCDLFPQSKRRASALQNAGLAFQRLSEWRLALERFHTLEAMGAGKESLEASFRAAECLYQLRQLADARKALDQLAARKDLEPSDQIRALTQRGIVELEDGDPSTAERSLRAAVAAFSGATDRERIDDYYPSQAQYFLGELYRGYFLDIRLDPSVQNDEKLGEELESKAEMLLSAQGHYLRAIKMGNSEWSVAAGYRIGELYDALYQELTQAPIPKNLGPEGARVYREELRKKIRVLVTKAIGVYERTLTAAQRTGVSNPIVEKTQSSLERMKQVLLETEGAEPSSEAPSPPPARGPKPGA